jgi:hypothetical protein
MKHCLPSNSNTSQTLNRSIFRLNCYLYWGIWRELPPIAYAARHHTTVRHVSSHEINITSSGTDLSVTKSIELRRFDRDLKLYLCLYAYQYSPTLHNARFLFVNTLWPCSY